MLYVDTSVLVALFTREGKSAAVSAWYGTTDDDMVSAEWCVTEFASALGIKQRTGQLQPEQAREVWHRFERLCANDLRLLRLAPGVFQRAAQLTMDASSGLRAGDALHLAAALDAGAERMATLDEVLARNAVNSRLGLVAL